MGACQEWSAAEREKIYKVTSPQTGEFVKFFSALDKVHFSCHGGCRPLPVMVRLALLRFCGKTTNPKSEVFAVYAYRPKGRHLSQNDRCKIEFLFDRKYSQREIADIIGVHPSTICRELRRAKITLLNSDLTTRVAYSATIAQEKADFAQTSKGRPLKIG